MNAATRAAAGAARAQCGRFIVEMRAKMPIAIMDAYYDDKGQALCPMATGI